MANRGAGIVARNTVANIKIRLQDNGFQQQKTLIMACVVGQKMISKRKIIVVVVTRHTVVVDGSCYRKEGRVNMTKHKE